MNAKMLVINTEKMCRNLSFTEITVIYLNSADSGYRWMNPIANEIPNVHRKTITFYKNLFNAQRKN